MSLPEQPHLEQQRIILLFENLVRQQVEARFRTAGAKRLVDEVECVVSHVSSIK